MAEKDVDPVDPVDAHGAVEDTRAETDPVETDSDTKVLRTDKSPYVVVADPAAVAAASTNRKAKPSKGPLKPESLSADYVVVKDRPPTSATEVLDEPRPAPANGTSQVVYVASAEAPKAQGNRSFGALVAVAASVLFAVLLAFAVLLIFRSMLGYATMDMLAHYGYWLPVATFLVAMLIAVLLSNRAGWWTYIFSSAIVAVVVYLASAALITIITFYSVGTSGTFVQSLASPTAIAAGIIAREVALWSGAVVSRRGRQVRARNAEARAAFQREQASDVE